MTLEPRYEDWLDKAILECKRTHPVSWAIEKFLLWLSERWWEMTHRIKDE